eukprot:TRINITY_DN4890_c0_g1_i5.p3 TRINITY_DN4890_c0_g1~~TRINITY_DN4890_c0_g1_i5.p3  ORF type:complete len:110 (-),score=2.44 TRINITY_DN4890_c0_g1_i5:746-1075(-)
MGVFSFFFCFFFLDFVVVFIKFGIVVVSYQSIVDINTLDLHQIIIYKKSTKFKIHRIHKICNLSHLDKVQCILNEFFRMIFEIFLGEREISNHHNIFLSKVYQKSLLNT